MNLSVFVCPETGDLELVICATNVEMDVLVKWSRHCSIRRTIQFVPLTRHHKSATDVLICKSKYFNLNQ